MTLTMRHQISELWCRIVRMAPDEIFGPLSRLLLHRHAGDLLAQPGFVGPQFELGNLVLLGMNPGAGDNKGLSSLDQHRYRILKRLRDASSPAEELSAFDDLVEDYLNAFPHREFYTNYIDPILSGSGITIEEVAVLNLLKWRTEEKIDNDLLKELYERSWKHHTRPQIDLLRPGMVVVLGSDAASNFRRLYLREFCYEVPRVIGNNIDDRGRAAVEECVRALRQRSRKTPSGDVTQ